MYPLTSGYKTSHDVAVTSMCLQHKTLAFMVGVSCLYAKYFAESLQIILQCEKYFAILTQ